jgi:transposase
VVAQLEAKVLELEEKLKTNSNNSSKPPSQDPFRSKRSSAPTGKKPGGQPGHPGHARQMYPLEKVVTVMDLKPQDCPNCGLGTFETSPISVECRQTVELPIIQPEITQYNIYTCRCGKCGKHVRAGVPLKQSADLVHD